MMEFYLMQETPEGSGTYADVRESGVFATADEAAAAAVEKASAGGRYAIRVYEAARSEAARAADMAETQAMFTPPAPPPAAA